ncbi:MAG: hypothetical protein WAT20_12650 [Ferruginibacter sp.]|nr:hypothetical protein [Chitinophagaceae bacterium]
MKKMITANAKKLSNRAALLLTTLLLSCYSFAQDKKIDVNINTKSDNGDSFFMQPWVWIVGGAVFILLLIALLRGNNSKK